MTGGSLALVGARVVPVTAPPIEGGTVLVSSEGRIMAVGGPGLPVPSDAERIDVAGKWVLPGLVDAHTYLGIQEDGNGAAGADQDEVTEPNGARFRAVDGVNPADPAFRDAIVGGVLAAGISAGSATPIGGQAVAVRCHGRTVDDLVLRDPCGMSSALGEEPKSGEPPRWPGTRMGTAAVIREAFARARRYVERGETGDVAADLGSAALARVLAGEIPWRQHAHRADDIATAIRLADEFGYRLVVLRGTDSDAVAETLAERDIPVVLGPLMTSRRRAEMGRRSLRTPARLAAAGVRLALTTRHYTNPIHTLPHQAAFAVREGLDRATALEAITVAPAEILGIADRVGSLGAGKDADLCVWSGDPFDVANRVEAAYVRGERIYEYDHGRGVGVLDGVEWTL